MGGQVLGGGVIVLVAALLWLVYLLPSWHSRRQFDAAERNAVRLNQALRVLAETSETPDEVRLELNARTALAQQRLARRALAEREHVALEQSRIDLELARSERAAARADPLARRTRARRRMRLFVAALGLVSVVAAVWGGFDAVATGSQFLLWTGVVSAVMAGLVLRRMSRVGARSVLKTADAAHHVERSAPGRSAPRRRTRVAASRPSATAHRLSGIAGRRGARCPSRARGGAAGRRRGGDAAPRRGAAAAVDRAGPRGARTGAAADTGSRTTPRSRRTSARLLARRAVGQ